MRPTRSIPPLAALAALLALAGPARAAFGFGKKKEDPAARAAAGAGLPGMDSPPRMAQESSQEEGGAPRVSASETAVGDHPSGSLPEEVVIRGEGGAKLQHNKPPLSIDVDPFESIRESLKPDQSLLLAESPLTVVWRRTHPEFLYNERGVRPWLTTFSDRPGIIFQPLVQLQEALQRKVESKDAKRFQWSLTVADEEGKVFQHYEGSKDPPEEIVWNGQNDQGEWVRAGSAYSPVYMFTDPGGTPYTRVGKPIRYKGIVHQERTGLHLTLDSAALFGRTKSRTAIEPEGIPVVRSAADLIKRRHSGIPIRVEAYAGTQELAQRQAEAVERYLIQELMLLPQDISVDADRAPYADQRLEIVLLNR